MKNYIFQVITPKVSSRFITKVRTSIEGLHAGNIVVADTLDNTIQGNYEVYSSQIPTTAGLGSKFMAVLINDNFETLVDGRRPAGNPNYYSYTYNKGETVTAIFLEKHLMFNVGFDCVSQTSQNLIAVGNYLVPTNNSYEFAAVENVPNGTYCALKILALYNTPVGGNYGGGMAMSMICTPVFPEDKLDDLMLTFTVPNQVGNTVINSVDNTISLTVASSRANLVATFTASQGASVTVGQTPQVSGTTSNNFTSPVVYTVTGQDGSTRNYTVTISLATYDLSVAPSANATVSVTRNGSAVNAGTDVLTYGDSITITATPNAGYEITSLQVNNVDFTSGNVYQVTSDVSIVAQSELEQYTLTINATNATVEVLGPEEVELETGSDIYYDEVLTITATPADTFTGVTLQVNNQPFTSGNTFTVTGNVTIDAAGTN